VARRLIFLGGGCCGGGAARIFILECGTILSHNRSLFKPSPSSAHRTLPFSQASASISSIQELLEGRQELTGSAAGNEAVRRVKESQRLIGKFLAESGVEDEKVSAFVAAH